MAGNDQVSSSDLASSLGSLGETTTAAELVRKQGQSKKLKVISEKKLMEWLLSLLKQHMAGKADSFSDAEKEELLRKTQDELKKRMLREQANEAERARLEAEKEEALAAVHEEKAGKADYEKVIASLKAQLENAQNSVQDLQQDNYDLQDQLQEKMALLSTTIAEKDKLRETVRNQMVHSGDLIGGVLGIDNQYYGGRHQEENPVPEEAGQDEQFYHDFGVGAKVIETLMGDLERLRGIATQAEDDKAAAEKDPRKNLLEGDLALLEQLKQGSLQAMDVAQPVATLIEALEGARSEAEAMEDAVARVTGNSSQKQPFTSLPDADGEASEVLAGAATVARELAAELARSRQRVIALKQIADEAENERGEMEASAQQVRDAHDKLLAALHEKAAADRHPAAAKLADASADPAARGDAALAVIEKLQSGSPAANEAMAENLASAERLVADADGAGKAQRKTAPEIPADQAALAARLRQAGAALEKLVIDQRRELADAAKREQALAEQVRSLAKAHSAAPDATRDMDVERQAALLDQALAKAEADPKAAGAATEAAEHVVEALQRQAATEQASTSARLKKLSTELEKAKSAESELEQARTELRQLQDQARARAQGDKAMANQLLKAAKGDETLAEASTDLALAIEQGADAQQAAEELGRHLQGTVVALTARKIELARENERLGNELEHAKSDLFEVTQRHDQSATRERELADTLVAAAKKDPDLADSTAELALALDEGKPDEPLAADVAKHVAATIQSLSERKRAIADEAERLKAELETARAQMQEANERAGALESERDEMAESGKEIITQLRQQKDSREKELGELREENDKAAAKLEEFQSRMAKAENANRKLAEALTAFAGAAAKHELANAPSIEDPRMDLEVVLSQLPSEGEEDVVAPADIAEQIAESGGKLAEALAARHAAAAAALAKAEQGQSRLLGEIEKLKGDIQQTRTMLEERDSALRRNQAEVGSIRREMSDQGNALAARVQELSNARSELAGAKADLDTANQRLGEQESRLAEARAQLSEARKELDLARSAHTDAHSRAESAEQNQMQIAQSLRSLGSMGGQGMSDPISKAAQKLELARKVGGDDLASAGKAFVETVKTHAQNLSQELAGAKTQLDGAKAENARLGDELAGQRAALVDREHALESLKTEAAKRDEAHAQATAQMLENGAELETLKERLGQLQGQLRQVEAELEDYRAREGASAGHFGDEVTQLRAEVAKEHAARKQLDAELHDLREKIEASEARLKRQREEFTRRLEERDAVINEKDRLLDEHGGRKIDAHGLEAQVEALTKQLATAQERVNELENLHGAHAGATSKSGDLAKELKKAQQERDGLREKQRKLEGDLADAVSSQEELQTQLDEKRKEVQGAREEMTKELGEERQKTGMLKEEFRKLKEEVVGLRARLRRLTDDKH